jgi:hypothetical protein
MTETLGPAGTKLLLAFFLVLGLACVAYGDASEPNTPLASLGPKPEEEEDLRTVFLRNASVILSPGTWDLEVGLDYRRGKTEAVGDTELTRQLRMPMTARFGIVEGWEGAISVPLIYSYRESYDVMTFDADSDDEMGLGDLTGGVSFQLMEEQPSWPEMIGTVQVRAPTGEDPYRGRGNEPPLGSGHWAVGTSLQFVRTADPLILFWGIGYFHRFSERSAGLKYEPGEGVEYNMGLGFSVNDDVSLSGRFAGVFV